MKTSWDEYYLAVLEAVRKRSTCDRGESGAIIIKDNRLLTTGYVGAPVGMPHCDDVGHLIEFHGVEEIGMYPQIRNTKHCIRTVHAELNAILQAASFGISIKGATMYCTMVPCFGCAKAIVNVGIKKVVAVYPYQEQKETVELFWETRVYLKILNKEKGLY